MHLHGFHHLAISVRDLERVSAFYRDVLGLPVQTTHRRADGTVRSVWHEVAGGAFLALEEVDGTPTEAPFRTDSPGMHLFALRIGPGERAAWEQSLATHGVEIVHRTRWTLYVRDPEGNRVALSHHPSDAPQR